MILRRLRTALAVLSITTLVTTALVSVPIPAASADSLPSDTWPYRRICSQGQITESAVQYVTPKFAGLPSAAGTTLSTAGWIRPCPGDVPKGAGYSFVGYGDDTGELPPYPIAFDHRSEQTDFSIRYRTSLLLRAACLIDHAEGDPMNLTVSKVACVGITTDPSDDTLVVEPISVDDPRVNRPVFLMLKATSLCGGCA